MKYSDNSWVVKPDVTEAAGSLQVSAGIRSGAEASCHSMREMFEEETTEGLILVDAKMHSMT